MFTMLKHIGEWRFWYNTVVFLSFGLLLAIIVMDYKHFHRIENETISKMLKKLVTFFIMGLVIVILENMVLIEIYYSGTLLFLVLNSFGIYYTLHYIFLNEASTNTTYEQIKDVLAVHEITERESEIVALILESYTNKEIADELYISEGTVKNHIYKIYKKTNVRNRTELVNYLKPLK